MGKSIPVKLNNGRSWAQKEMASSHFREMLGRYSVGERVLNADDHSDLAALLNAYDALVPLGQPTKAGSGIAYFEKDVDLCWRRLNIDPPCRSNIDPGADAAF